MNAKDGYSLVVFYNPGLELYNFKFSEQSTFGEADLSSITIIYRLQNDIAPLCRDNLRPRKNTAVAVLNSKSNLSVYDNKYDMNDVGLNVDSTTTMEQSDTFSEGDSDKDKDFNIDKYSESTTTDTSSNPDFDLRCTHENVSRNVPHRKPLLISGAVKTEPRNSNNHGIPVENYVKVVRNTTKKVRCRFCGEDIAGKNFKRHLERNHAAEKELKNILEYPKKSKERKQAMAFLRNETNFELLLRGTLRPNREMQTSVESAEYVPCSYCKGLFIKEYLCRHLKKCKAFNSDMSKGNKLSMSHTLIACAADPTDTIARLNVKKKQLLDNDQSDVNTYKERRIGDVQFMKIKDYEVDRKTNNNEFESILTETEKILTKKYKRVINGGKGSRAVVVLVPEAIQDLIATFLKYIDKYVSKNNDYLFTIPGSRIQWGKGDVAIRMLTNRITLDNPGAISSNKLRKQIATIMQILNLSRDETKQFSDFMGHTQKTHEEFYELPVDIYQTAKVSKILLMMEKGTLPAAYKGKSLSELQVDKLEYAEENDGLGWLNEECNLIIENFEGYINTATYPTGAEIQRFIKRTKINRKVLTVRAKIQHLINLRKRKRNDI
nr:unnamed protein product [Callosobruchus analis]